MSQHGCVCFLWPSASQTSSRLLSTKVFLEPILLFHIPVAWRRKQNGSCLLWVWLKKQLAALMESFFPSRPQDFLLHKDSMGQELRQGTREMACLCSIKCKASAGETHRLLQLNSWDSLTWRHLPLHFRQIMLAIGWDIGWVYWWEQWHGAFPCRLGFLTAWLSQDSQNFLHGIPKVSVTRNPGMDFSDLTSEVTQYCSCYILSVEAILSCAWFRVPDSMGAMWKNLWPYFKTSILYSYSYICRCTSTGKNRSWIYTK